MVTDHEPSALACGAGGVASSPPSTATCAPLTRWPTAAPAAPLPDRPPAVSDLLRPPARLHRDARDQHGATSARRLGRGAPTTGGPLGGAAAWRRRRSSQPPRRPCPRSRRWPSTRRRRSPRRRDGGERGRKRVEVVELVTDAPVTAIATCAATGAVAATRRFVPSSRSVRMDTRWSRRTTSRRATGQRRGHHARGHLARLRGLGDAARGHRSPPEPPRTPRHGCSRPTGRAGGLHPRRRRRVQRRRGGRPARAVDDSGLIECHADVSAAQERGLLVLSLPVFGDDGTGTARPSSPGCAASREQSSSARAGA